jgi:hypothetical protein
MTNNDRPSDDQHVVQIIATAAVATADVHQIIARASNYLDHLKTTNALGVLTEPRALRENLIVVRAEMDRAIAIINAAKWPTARDYDKT